jgi:lysophospholipase L1-like esterase
MFKRFAFLVLYVAIIFSIFSIAFEYYLRNFVFDPNQYYVYLPGWEIIFHPSQAGLPGVPEDSHVRINSLGMRSKTISSGMTPLVLAVGGSTTEDIVLNDGDTWTGQLEHDLRRCHPVAWVGNMGKAGTNATHHALQLEKILPRLPHLDRILLLVGLNDMLHDSYIHHPNDLPADWDRRQAFTYAPPEHPALIQRSAAYQFLAQLWGNRRRFTDPDAALVRIVDFGAMEESYKERFRQVAPEDFIVEAPDLTQPLAKYRGVLNRIADIGDQYGSRITFITQPSLWKPNMTEEERSRLYAGGVGSVDQWFVNPHTKWYSTDAMRVMLSAYNDVLLDVCKSRALDCIDLAHELPKDAADFYDDFHFSKAGAARIGQILAKALDPNCAL